MGFAVLFKFFQYEARFPSHKFEVPKAVIQYIAKQIETPAELYAQYDWAGRSITYHRTQIREFFGFREDTVQDADEVIDWLCKNVLFHDHDFEHLVETVYRRREMKIVPPSRGLSEPQFTHTRNSFSRLHMKSRLRHLYPNWIHSDKDGSSVDEGLLSFQELKADPGEPGVESVATSSFFCSTNFAKSTVPADVASL
ncbi:hypothetical protein B1748_33510 [Paenibacillus sp. MY03]|nr:hypothetical protein B1748_33510 [Paenibacillus sp. MY03]